MFAAACLGKGLLFFSRARQHAVTACCFYASRLRSRARAERFLSACVRGGSRIFICCQIVIFILITSAFVRGGPSTDSSSRGRQERFTATTFHVRIRQGRLDSIFISEKSSYTRVLGQGSVVRPA